MTTAERLRKEAAQRILTDQPRAVSLLADAADELDRLSAENERLRLEHEAYRPEVAAEIAVHLAEDADWQAIAEWCGGRVQWETLPSGDVVSWINVGVGRAGEGAWITLGHDGVFRVRWSLDGPERADLVAENERLREALRRILDPGRVEGWIEVDLDHGQWIHTMAWDGNSSHDVAGAIDAETLDLLRSILGHRAASLSETGGEAEAPEREWYCEAIAVGLADAGTCSPERPIHTAPCGWTGGEGA